MEPHTTTAGALVGTISSVPLAFLPGVEGSALWIGMIVAFCVTFLLDAINTPRKSASAVVLASLSSGYGSADIASVMVDHFPKFVDPLHIVSAILIAAAVPVIIATAPMIWPIVIRVLNRKGDSL